MEGKQKKEMKKKEMKKRKEGEYIKRWGKMCKEVEKRKTEITNIYNSDPTTFVDF